MSSADGSRLIVGLGNPGPRYAKTRHNFGFMVLEAFAKKLGWPLKGGVFKKDLTASGVYEGKKLYLLLPMTYMNLSGEAVGKLARYRKIDPTNVMIVVDDVDIPFGTCRMRASGSSGGHNGLKSIEQCLGTRNYPRLRMGIKNKMPKQQALEDYVLEPFSKEEQQELPRLIEDGVNALEDWLEGAALPNNERTL